jgi:8-oxo-dGTP diphosphatase
MVFLVMDLIMPASDLPAKIGPAEVMPVPAVGVVCMKGDQVLLIRRGNPPLKGSWSLPGGRIEAGERAADAALRELREETGLTAELIGLVDVVDGLFTSRSSGELTRHYVLIDYAARWLQGEPRAGDDAEEARWFGPQALDALDLWSETRRIIALARKMQP